MRYIIDGYNVINSSDIFLASSLESRRNKLIEFIKFYRPHGKLSNFVTIVFDCKSKNPYDSRGYNKINIEEIEIIFSDGIATADDIIVGFVEEAKNPYEIIVITNDKGILRRIGLTGAKHESVERFLERGIRYKSLEKVNSRLDMDASKKITEEFEKLWVKKE